MNVEPKILPQHLERQAYVYIRQSSPKQVEEHLESQDLQYQLVHRARALGWRQEQVEVIDDDLGKSAATTTDREGFQVLVAAVGLGQVGIILVTDVSRLARNCADWYQLLDLASVYNALISDGSGIYNPRLFNDRLLLGLKGTFSEAQWYNMRTQLYAALLNKARRGELATRLPVGYDREPDGKAVFCPDREVQQAIRLVFAQFKVEGSARAVMRYFRDEGLELPRRVQTGPDQGQIRWVRPSYSIVYHILKHPAYAGAYTYGKHHRVRAPGTQQKVVTRRLPMEEWPVLLHDALPGYITWEQYLSNQERLRENAMGSGWSKGAPLEGVALLQGIAICGRCGRRLRSRYRRYPAYLCEATKQQYGEKHCQRFTVAHVDKAVSEVFLQAVEPGRLEAALAAVDEVEAQRQRLASQWEQRLERAEYEADLARRRYELVDPENRLVAAELEHRWEEKLQTLRRLQQEWAQARNEECAPLGEAEKAAIRSLAEDVPALWHAETTTHQERKRLLRCLARDVTLDSFTKPGFSILHVRWHTGTTTTVEVKRPLPGRKKAVALIERVRELAQHYPDDQIADILNEEGVRNAVGQEWNLGRVRSVRYKNDIQTACPYVKREPGPRGDGLIPAKEAAEALGVSRFQIAEWFRFGWLVGHQRQVGSPVWIRVTDEDRRRWTGAESVGPTMVPVGEAPDALGMSRELVAAEVRAGRVLTYRMRIKNRWRWYVRVPAERATRKLCS
jgi:DNA invertase Pin-like site-specific DNA recombinase